MRTKIENFLKGFPKNATSWSQATDELRDIAQISRVYLEDYDGIIVEVIDFSGIWSPAEWNTKGREYILANFDRMSDDTKKRFYTHYQDWFEMPDEEEQEMPPPPTREEMIVRIYGMHDQAKKTDVGSFLISRAQLETHLAMHDYETLHAILRFYIGLTTPDEK